MRNYAKHVNPVKTPQNRPIPGREAAMVQNAEHAYVFKIEDEKRLERFLTIGTEGGTYYAKEGKLTRENAATVGRLLATKPGYVLGRAATISDEGRAPKNDPAIFVLAMGCSLKDNAEAREAAKVAFPKIVRTGTHLFQFAEMLKTLGRPVNGRFLKGLVGSYYTSREAEQVAYQVAKYRNRAGWTHGDILRVTHIAPKDPAMDSVFHWVRKGVEGAEWSEEKGLLVKGMAVPKIIEGLEKVKGQTNPKIVVGLIREYGLTREMLPTEVLNDPRVWEALLENMPYTAMLRNLGNMSKVDLIKATSKAEKLVCERLTDAERVQKARVHPINVLTALKTYNRGSGIKGSNTWRVSQRVSAALDDAFYMAFKNVEPTGKNVYWAIDVSSSMTSWGWGEQGYILTPHEIATAFALVGAKTEPNSWVFGFCHDMKDLRITRKDTLESALKKTQDSFGSTDCAIPMQHARSRGMDIDAFVVITDNETGSAHGFGAYGRRSSEHPAQALRSYRKAMNKRAAKLVVLGVTATECSIADPEDMGMLDVAGFDSAVPQLVADFIRD